MKAQKALSGGTNKSTIKQVPASLLQPLRPRIETSAAQSHASHASPYAQILPRPPTNTSQSPSPQIPASAPAPHQASPYHKHGYPVQASHGGLPGAGPLHPAIRPQYGAPQPQHPGQASHHHWQTAPQPPTAAASQPKQPFTKQSHSPIPLPPYVRQMAPGPPSAPKPSAPNRHPEQATSQAPQNPFAAPPTAGQPSPGFRIMPTPAPGPQSSQSPQQPGQWTTTGGGEGNPTAAQQWAPQAAAPTPNRAMQQSPNGQTWAPAPQAQPTQPAPQSATPGAAGSPTGVDGHDNSALLEKMMMNLRRASQNFGKLEEGQSLVDERS
jgi:hypothetical protein